MIKKSVFEDDLIAGMQRELANSFEKKASMNDLAKAADYLHAAIEIFEEAGMTAKADQVLNILTKIAENAPPKPKNPTKVSDSHTQGLTPDKMVSNLKEHGTVFNMADDGGLDNNDSEDLLELDINEAALGDFEELPEDKTFEDSD